MRGASTWPAWCAAILRCPVCGASPLEAAAEALVCGACGHHAAVEDGVASLLVDEHPSVASERRAVARLDAGEVTLDAPQLPHADVSVSDGDGADGDGSDGDRSDGDGADGDQAANAARAAAYHQHVASTRRRVAALLAADPPIEGSVLVELGADACQTSDLFLDAGCRVLAVDITDHLRLAPRGDDPHLARAVADMNRLPLQDAVADIVWATAAAHHSWDLARTFAEAARVLRPGGRLVFCSEPMPGWLRWLAGFGVGVGDEERALGINETWVRRGTWLRLARGAGFDARIEAPPLDDAELHARLAARRLGWLPPALVRGVLGPFRVSMNLIARRAGA
ncbi:MAG: methyltransferase domain-containing protein [Acidobacteriota bacterium]